MVPFFVGYALIVWWLTCRWRRTLRGFAMIALGIAVLMLINWAHIKLGDWSESNDPDGNGFYIPVLQAVMWPYTALVAAVGVYIVVLPVPERAGTCAGCGYDLGGLARPVRTCPECGARAEPDADGRRYRRSGERRVDLASTDFTNPE